jgi:hypothetical protein
VLQVEAGLQLQKIYPNPWEDMLSFDFQASQNAEVRVEISNAYGEIVARNTFAVNKNQTHFEFTPQKVVSGLYCVRLLDATNQTMAVKNILKK